MYHIIIDDDPDYLAECAEQHEAALLCYAYHRMAGLNEREISFVRQILEDYSHRLLSEKQRLWFWGPDGNIGRRLTSIPYRELGIYGKCLLAKRNHEERIKTRERELEEGEAFEAAQLAEKAGRKLEEVKEIETGKTVH